MDKKLVGHIVERNGRKKREPYKRLLKMKAHIEEEQSFLNQRFNSLINMVTAQMEYELSRGRKDDRT